MQESPSDKSIPQLNERQQAAVEATEGRVRVVAGAGSGKTRVLAHRYAFLVNELGISPGNILCLTFTNKAAQEMKHRIARMVDRGSVNDFICTIHSFCVKFLRREIYRLGYPKSFTVIDEEDSKTLAKQAMEEFGIDRRKLTAERFLGQVAEYKGYDINRYIHKHLLPASDDNAPDAIIRYIRLQLKHFTLDYDDLIYFTIYILLHFPDAKEYWTDKLNYIMVDEVQDCSSDDWRLLNILASKHHNLFCVGDPDQAIYEWRGANPRIFVEFKADPGCDIILNRNYRSTPDILDVANYIIANNQNRVPKELYTMRLNEMRPVYHHCRSEKEEAQYVADTIEEQIRQGESPKDFAVLFRSSFLSRGIEQQLLKRKIAYSVWGGVRFFDRKEIKDLICYLRLVASDADDLAFTRIINLPARKFGNAAMKNLREIADATGTSLMTALRESLNTPRYNKASIRQFVGLIDAAREWSAQMRVSDLADKLLNTSGLADLYRLDEREDRLENIAELINSMREFELSQDDDDDRLLDAYLQEIALYTNVDAAVNNDKVKLMTIHQSKGLEFHNVFIIGLTEGVFPNHRSIRERRKDGEEEERRLMYVAVTRAEKCLYLTESEGYMNDNGALKYPSRFISEVPEILLTIEGNPDPALFEGTKTLVNMLNCELGQAAEPPMAPGTVVIHKVFGRGTILSFNPAAQSYRVKFESGERDLIPRVLTKEI